MIILWFITVLRVTYLKRCSLLSLHVTFWSIFGFVGSVSATKNWPWDQDARWNCQTFGSFKETPSAPGSGEESAHLQHQNDRLHVRITKEKNRRSSQEAKFGGWKSIAMQGETLHIRFVSKKKTPNKRKVSLFRDNNCFILKHYVTIVINVKLNFRFPCSLDVER